MRKCDKKCVAQAWRRRKGLPWDALRTKAEVTAFQPVIWSWIKGLDLVSGAAPTRKQFCI